jgi:hypothetical protein
MEKSKDCCYEEMTKTIGGQSQPQPYHEEPMRNEYENTRKGYNSNGLDKSGMKK